MIRNVDLISYLPQYLRGYREIREALQAQQPEVQRLEDLTEDIMNNQFILSSNEPGVRRFEHMLGVAALDDDLLENRKFRMLSLWNNAIPYTMAVLHKKLATLCGEDGYKLEIFPEEYRIDVRIALKSKKNFNMVQEMLCDVLPANLLLDVSLLYNQHATLSEFTYGQLSSYTYDQLRNEVLTNGD